MVVVVVRRHALVLDASAHHARLLGAFVLTVRADKTFETLTPRTKRILRAFWHAESLVAAPVRAHQIARGTTNTGGARAP